MSSNTLCNLVRAAVIAVAVCGAALCGYILPALGGDIARAYPELSHCLYPWLGFLWTAALPCFAILWLVWKVADDIKNESVFTVKTARLVKLGAIILFCDVGYFFVGNFVLALLGMSQPGILFLSFFADVFGVSLAVLAAVLARYLTKAAALQEDADSTI
jgi:MFS family permease